MAAIAVVRLFLTSEWMDSPLDKASAAASPEQVDALKQAAHPDPAIASRLPGLSEIEEAGPLGPASAD